MNTIVRTTLATAALAPAILLAPGAAAAEPAPASTFPAVHPVVLIGQHQDPIAALLACAPVGLIPVFGPNIIFPICLA
ncbi:hypothetical protein ACFYVR_21155 [Rhodococcus sp. NPDC003318]|uniref:hypothetical protein n=1 Tax=Rhodococcus sp. NPDC003318 TaxID=3364503 RepID=UPI00369F9B71